MLHNVDSLEDPLILQPEVLMSGGVSDDVESHKLKKKNPTTSEVQRTPHKCE